MEPIFVSSNPADIAFAKSLLSSAHIDVFELDVHMSVLEGSIGVFPRRLMVHRDYLSDARLILKENGLDPQ